MNENMEESLYNALEQLHDKIPRLADLLDPGADEQICFWTHIVEAKLLSRLSPDFPMVAAICGGGSSGKSTLFNSLVGQPLAPTGGTAGLNRRVLFSVPADRAEHTGLLADLAAPFELVPEPLQDPRDLTVPGKPLYVINRSDLNSLVLLDTPDFDTGARGTYTNREVTRMALEASDILIYIFTNSNYNNRDNTDFIARMLTGIGKRKCFLVYRAYPSFTDAEIIEHAMTVAKGIYGQDAERYVLGVYRTDEDNRVAAGQQFMQLAPVRPKAVAFDRALQGIDAPRLRLDLYGSILDDVLRQARQIQARSEVSLDELRLYLDALLMAQSHCVHEALKHFPMDRVMRRFARIWADTDPAHVKMMRKTGNLIELPIKMLLGAAGWAKKQLSPAKDSRPSSGDFAQKLDEDLVTAVTDLHYQAVSAQISVAGSLNDAVARKMLEITERIREQKQLPNTRNPRAEASGESATLTFQVDAHPAVLSAQEKLRGEDFKSLLQAILAQKDAIVNISHEMENDLCQLADRFRSKMGRWRKISQTFWAFLNVLPATVAVTYVLSTGDPVGAAGIKIKLTGLFGAKDLYALFAIPVTTGLKSAERKQIEEMLGPIVQTWLNHKLETVQQLFEQTITGGIIRGARKNIDAADALIGEIGQAMAVCAGGDETS